MCIMFVRDEETPIVPIIMCRPMTVVGDCREWGGVARAAWADPRGQAARESDPWSSDGRPNGQVSECGTYRPVQFDTSTRLRSA